jgi:excinuclease ABC subunit C
VLGVPGLQRHHYVCVGKSPAPYVYVATVPTGKELGVYGPLVKWWRSDDAVRRLNDWFRLRDCPSTVPLGFSDQPELFPEAKSAKCLRHELGTCWGPCAAACSAKEYGAGVRGVKAFLDGRDRTVLGKLRETMEAAATAFEFEKATAVRDRLQALEWLDDRLTLLRKARNRNSFVYPLTGHDGRERWYLIHRGQVRAVCYTPTTEAEKAAVPALLAAAFGGGPESPVLSDVAGDSVLLVDSWLRKYTNERAKLMSRTVAEERCRRAGPG